MAKTIKFKFRDDEKQTEPSKLKHVCQFEIEDYLRWDKIVCEFQVFLEKLGFDYLSKDKIDMVKLINDEFDRQDNEFFKSLKNDEESCPVKNCCCDCCKNPK